MALDSLKITLMQYVCFNRINLISKNTLGEEDCLKNELSHNLSQHKSSNFYKIL